MTLLYVASSDFHDDEHLDPIKFWNEDIKDIALIPSNFLPNLFFHQPQ